MHTFITLLKLVCEGLHGVHETELSFDLIIVYKVLVFSASGHSITMLRPCASLIGHDQGTLSACVELALIAACTAFITACYYLR
jgi:hypothetical protein